MNDSPDNFDSVLKEIKIINVPISIKISPDSSNGIIGKIAEICCFHDQVMINAGNSQYKSKAELNIPSNSLTTIGGGLSGTSLFNRTLEVVKILAPFNIPIIATGGINNFDQIEILKKEGAALFGMATALIFNPYCIPKINSNLKMFNIVLWNQKYFQTLDRLGDYGATNCKLHVVGKLGFELSDKTLKRAGLIIGTIFLEDIKTLNIIIKNFSKG